MLYGYKYMLFASREVPIKKNCARGLEYRPRWYSRQIVQFFPERTDLNWWIIYIYIYIYIYIFFFFFFFFFNLRKFFLKEPEWFKAVTTARSSINWTIFERVKTPLYTFEKNNEASLARTHDNVFFKNVNDLTESIIHSYRRLIHVRRFTSVH